MPNENTAEKRFESLVKGNTPENRVKHALKAREQGKKVIGLLCTYAPEEVVYAAGMLPWRITGTWDSDLSRAAVHRDMDSCRYCTHALESLLRGDLGFLDGIMDSDWDDDRRRLFDTWVYASKPPFTATFIAPKSRSQICERYFAEDVSGIVSSLETFGGRKITEDSLRAAISTCNQTRSLLMRLYELRKRVRPPVTGAEVLGITTASMVMDKAEFNAELEAVLPYLEHRGVGPKHEAPRILVSSDMLDNPAYIEVIESEGCRVVMDDLDTGSRYFYKLVDENAPDPIRAIARRYLWRPADPIAFNWEEQIAQIIEWVRDWRVDGVIELYEEFSPGRQWRSPLLVRELARADIPLARISRTYDLGSVHPLRTRVAAFLEMLSTPVRP